MNKIVSAVVTYNYDDSFYDNLNEILQQSHVIWIDNSTNHVTNKEDKIFIRKNNITFIKNEVNEGLSKTYNQSVIIAKSLGAKYFVTFDQDTKIQNGTLSSLVEIMEKYRLDSVGPRYFDRDRKDEVSKCKFLISSCNISKIQVYDKVSYDEKLFIDFVDLDFCMQLKQNGFKLGLVNTVHIAHQIGEKYEGKYGISFYAHNPKRYYYMFRNYYILRKKYKDPYLKKISVRLMIIKMVTIFLLKEKEKKEAMHYISRGIEDGKKI